MSLMNFAKMLKLRIKISHVPDVFQGHGKKKSEVPIIQKNEETTVPNDKYDYILSKTNRSSHMSLMNFLQLSSTTLLHANTNINNLDNPLPKSFKPFPLF